MRCQHISHEDNKTKEGGILTPTSMIKWGVSYVTYKWWSNTLNLKQTKQNVENYGLQQKLHMAHIIELSHKFKESHIL